MKMSDEVCLHLLKQVKTILKDQPFVLLIAETGEDGYLTGGTHKLSWGLSSEQIDLTISVAKDYETREEDVIKEDEDI